MYRLQYSLRRGLTLRRPRASAAKRDGLNDQIWLRRRNDFLGSPDVKWVLLNQDPLKVVLGHDGAAVINEIEKFSNDLLLLNLRHRKKLRAVLFYLGAMLEILLGEGSVTRKQHSEKQQRGCEAGRMNSR